MSTIGAKKEIPKTAAINTFKTPKNEIAWVVCYSENREELKYIVTSDLMRSKYFLYKHIDGKYKKVRTGKEPTWKEIQIEE